MRNRIIALLAAAGLLLLAFTGCSNPDGKKLLEDAAKKQDKAKSVKVGIVFDLDFDMSASDVSASLSNSMSGEVVISYSDSKNHMAMDFSMPSLLGISLNEECYYDSESKYLYLRSGSGWQKAKIEGDENPLGSVFDEMSMGTDDSEQMSSQSMASLFMLSKEINTIGRKDFNGVKCYEIEILLNPDVFKSLFSMAMSGAGTGLESLTGEDEDLIASMIDSMNIYAYVGSSDGLLHGIDMQMGEFFKAMLTEQAGNEAAEVQMNKTVFNVSIISDYKDDAIKIPDEALNATETDANELMSGSMMLQQFVESDDSYYEDDGFDYDENDNIDDDTMSSISFDNMRMVDSLTATAIGNEVDTYKTDAPAFHVVAEVSNITEPITVYIDWYKADNTSDQLIDTVSFEMDADNTITSTLSPHTTEWPAGEYYVEFSATESGAEKEDVLDLDSYMNMVFFSVE